MIETAQIYIENLREGLSRAENFILVGIAAAASFFLLTIHGGTDDKLETEFIGLFFPIKKDAGLVVAVALYWFVGGFAVHAALGATRAARALRDFPLAVAASIYSHPSILKDTFIGVMLALTPPMVVIYALSHIVYLNVWQGFFLAAPYLSLSIQVFWLRSLFRKAVAKVPKIAEVGACPRCRTIVHEEFNYCPGCRTRLYAKCPHCDRRLQEATRYCGYCGGEM